MAGRLANEGWLMPDTGCLLLSAMCLMAGGAFFLYPDPLLRISMALNRTMAVLDQKLVRFRYLVGLLLFISSYLLFKLALLVPGIRG